MQRHGNTPTRFVLVQGQNTPRHHSPHTKHIQAPFTTHKTHPGTIHHAQNKYPERDEQSDTDNKVGLLNLRCRSSHAPNMGYIVYTGPTQFPKRHTPTRHAEWRQPCPQRRPPRPHNHPNARREDHRAPGDTPPRRCHRHVTQDKFEGNCSTNLSSLLTTTTETQMNVYCLSCHVSWVCVCICMHRCI